MCEHFAAPALVRQWAPSIYKTSRRPSLVSKFAVPRVVAEKSSRKSTLQSENGGCRGCSRGTTVLGRKMRFLGNQDQFQDHLSCQEDLRSCSYDIISSFGIIRFLFSPVYSGIKKITRNTMCRLDPELKWQYYQHQIRGKCSPEQVLESLYFAWLANASSSRLTNCS